MLALATEAPYATCMIFNHVFTGHNLDDWSDIQEVLRDDMLSALPAGWSVALTLHRLPASPGRSVPDDMALRWILKRGGSIVDCGMLPAGTAAGNMVDLEVDTANWRETSDVRHNETAQLAVAAGLEFVISGSLPNPHLQPSLNAQLTQIMRNCVNYDRNYPITVAARMHNPNKQILVVSINTLNNLQQREIGVYHPGPYVSLFTYRGYKTVATYSYPCDSPPGLLVNPQHTVCACDNYGFTLKYRRNGTPSLETAGHDGEIYAIPSLRNL